MVHVSVENNKERYIKTFRIEQHEKCYNYFIWTLWDQCKLKFWLKKGTHLCVDDFYSYTWIDFIKEKSDTFDVFRKLCENVKNEQNCNISRIRSNHEREV